MDLAPEYEIDSGYEASNETTTETASPISEPSSIGPHVSAVQSRIVILRPSGRSQCHDTMKSRRSKTADHRTISSSSPETIQESFERARSREEKSSASSTSSFTTPSHEPTRLPQKIIRTGMTAREVAERAQDATLIEIGSQKTPAQLLKKIKRPASPTEGLALQSIGGCYDCIDKQIQCAHIPAEQGPIQTPSTHQALQHAVGLPITSVSHANKIKDEQTSKRQDANDGTERDLDVTAALSRECGKSSKRQGANDATGPELDVTAAPSRERGKTSKWQERRQKENLKPAGGLESKETGTEPPATRAVVLKKKGRPVGWRKGMGLTYAEVKRMSMREREDLIKMSGLRP